MINKLSLLLLVGLSIILLVTQSNASDEDLFSTNVPPDALIILDMSGSMNLNVAGADLSPPPGERRIDIARNVIYDLLDDDDSGKGSNNDGAYIDSNDERSLNVRLGYMRFRNIREYDNDDGNPFTGNIKVFTRDAKTGKPSTEIGAPYRDIWSRVSDAAETAGDFTPLAATLVEAKRYFAEYVNPQDDAIACRGKYIIFITDGSDTVSCGGDGSEDAPGMWRRRMLTVQRAKEAFEAGIKVFAVGFGGDMPDHLKKTLNWVAKYGGTDNSSEDNQGDPAGYDISMYIPKDAQGNDLDACSTDRSLATAADPANHPLSGYAFLAGNATELTQALKTILKYVKSQPYYVASPTVPSFRLSEADGEDNVVYMASFVPSNEPFWPGSLKKYRANWDGTLDESTNRLQLNLVWDASEQLKDIDPNSRNIKTYVNGAMVSFTYENLTNADLNVASDEDRRSLINHVRSQKLGDIFHSSAVIVGSPSRFFQSPGFSGAGGFYEKNKDRTKVIIVGANDGMLHAFNAQTGNEEWAFIPNSVLRTLKWMKTAHTYYVDGSPKVADVWFDSINEWRTVLICGLRKGGKHYFALDITDTRNPRYLWEFPKTMEILNKVGESWSDPAIGKVKTEKGDQWVAFIGGGFDPIDKDRGTEAITGKVFFVIDVMTGEIIKEFSGLEPKMRHSFPAPPTAVDTNADGYVDKVYVGDLAGQMWVFNVSFDETTQKSESQWTGRRLFEAPAEPLEKHNIYYQAAVAFDRYGIPWVYFGTGNREDPTDTKNPPEAFYAVMDDGKMDYPRKENNDTMRNVTGLFTFAPDRTKKGWFIKLEKTGNRLEKVLGKPTIFNKLLYFTTYLYEQQVDPCSVAGDTRLYVVEYVSGGGAFNLDHYLQRIEPKERWRKIGSGVGSSPVITLNTKGEASVIVGTMDGQVFTTKTVPLSALKEILYWREVIR
ncbi:MAG: pilus assembly protein [Thermodesulfobacteriota bacterium]